eukprot:scaffold169808_cov35-Tisochrysis_lutea.AAC.2
MDRWRGRPSPRLLTEPRRRFVKLELCIVHLSLPPLHINNGRGARQAAQRCTGTQGLITSPRSSSSAAHA